MIIFKCFFNQLCKSYGKEIAKRNIRKQIVLQSYAYLTALVDHRIIIGLDRLLMQIRLDEFLHYNIEE